jgi:hypothetical protein
VSTSLLLSCVCSSVWSFGSRLRNWRYIIARVSEMHVAYHTWSLLVVYLHPWNKQHSTSQTTLRYHSALPSFLPYLHHRMCVRGGENNDGYRVRLKIGVSSLLHRKVKSTTACCCHVFVPQYGRLAAIWSSLALYHCACPRNARRIS